MTALGRIHRADRAHLGHAPTVVDAYAELFRKRLHHRRRTSRSTDGRRFQCRKAQLVLGHVVEQVHPHGGHGRGAVDCLGFEQLVETCTIERGARKYQFRAHHGSGVRNTPGIDMEHRHDRQHRARCTQILGVRQGNREGVKDRRPVTEQHAFGMAGGSGGVAQPRSRVLIELRPFEIVAFSRE